MVTRLKSALRTLKHTLASNRNIILKGVIYALLLGFVVRDEFSLSSMALFFGLGFLLYVQPVFQTMSHLTPFILLTFIAVFTLRVFQLGQWYPLLVAFFGLLFFVLLGLKNVSFLHRRVWYTLFELSLMYLTAVAYFIVDKSQHLLLASFILYVAVYMLSKRFFLAGGARMSRHIKVTSLALSLVALELCWAFSVLPIGFMSAAGLLTLYIGTLQEMLRLYLEGTLTPRAVRYYLLFLLVVFIVVLFFSSWPA